MKIDVQNIVLILVVTSIASFFYGNINNSHSFSSNADLKYYEQIAESAPRLSGDIIRPFAYRFLGPYLAGILPLGINSSFRFLSVFFSLVLPIIFYLFLISTGISKSVSAMTSCFLVLNKYLFGFNVWDYFQVNDVMSLVFLVVLLFSLYNRRWSIFGIILLFGVLCKEIAILIIPTAFIFVIERRIFKSDFIPFILSVIPAIFLFVYLRVAIPVSGGTPLSREFFEHSGKAITARYWARILINSFIPFSILPLIFFRDTFIYIGRNIHIFALFVLVIISTLFAHDNERLMAPAFLAFYPLIARIIEHRFLRNKFFFVIAFFSAILASAHHFIARYPLPDRRLTLIFGAGATILVSITATYHYFIIDKKTNTRLSCL